MAKLCKAGQQLREQVDDAFPDRDRASDGWLGDAKHAARRSDHNPTDEGWVRALDIDADLRSHKSEAFDLADQLRLLARSDKRISYVIFNGKIASWRRNYRWRRYTGINPHTTHIHVSFTSQGDEDRSMFRIPLLTGEPINGKSKKGRRKLGKILLGSSSGNLPLTGVGTESDPRKCCQCRCASHNSLAQS